MHVLEQRTNDIRQIAAESDAAPVPQPPSIATNLTAFLETSTGHHASTMSHDTTADDRL